MGRAGRALEAQLRDGLHIMPLPELGIAIANMLFPALQSSLARGEALTALTDVRARSYDVSGGKVTLGPERAAANISMLLVLGEDPGGNSVNVTVRKSRSSERSGISARAPPETEQEEVNRRAVLRGLSTRTVMVPPG